MLLLLACQAPGVVWKGQGADQVEADIATTLFTLGLAETDDRALVSAPHAAGTMLDMELEVYVYESDAVGVTSMDEDVCTVETLGRTGESTEVRLTFGQAGSTDLFLTTREDGVVDWQPIEVRDPATLDVSPYEAVAVGDTATLTQLDVLPGSVGTLTATWRSAAGESLAGRGLLVAEADAPLTLTSPDNADQLAYERIDYAVADDAAGDASISLYAADEAVDPLPVVIHDPAEVTEVGIVSALEEDSTGIERGVVRGLAHAGDTALSGAPLTWTADGEPVGTGAWVEVGGEDAITRVLRSCYGDLCDELEVQGEILQVGGAAPEPTAACGCGSVPAAPWAGLFGLAAVLRRRRG